MVIVKILDYEIIAAVDFNDVVRYVKSGLEKGWQPYGLLLVVTGADEDRIYCQAMVKYE